MKKTRGSLTAIRKNLQKLSETCWMPVSSPPYSPESNCNDLKDAHNASTRANRSNSPNKQAVLFSHPRQLEPSPLTTKTQSLVFFKRLHVSIISSTPTLLRPIPSSLFFLHSHSSWVWGLAGRRKCGGPLFFFLPLFSPFLYFSGLTVFFFFFNRALAKVHVRWKQWGTVILHRKLQYIYNLTIPLERPCQPGESGVCGCSLSCVCRLTEWFTSHRENPMNRTHSQTFAFARTLELTPQACSITISL